MCLIVLVPLPYSAGALISTVGDLLKWEQALFNGQVVSQASQGAFPLDEQQEYGYGLIRETQDGRVSISHGGGINGFTSLMHQWLYQPDDLPSRGQFDRHHVDQS